MGEHGTAVTPDGACDGRPPPRAAPAMCGHEAADACVTRLPRVRSCGMRRTRSARHFPLSVVAVMAACASLMLAGCSSAPRPTHSPSTASPTAAESPSAGGTSAPAPAHTPTVSAVPAGFAAASVTFVSPEVGWALGTSSCVPVPCLTLLRTADAGSTWTRVGTPPAVFAAPRLATSGVGAVRFADARNGWLFSPDLWSTHDGGAHWRQVSLPGVAQASPVARLEAAGGMVHAAVFDNTGTVAIETAAVAGDAWHRSTTTIPLGAGPVPDVDLALHGGEGWIVENDRTVVGGARFHNGEWLAWQPPCSSSGGPAVLAASTATDLFALCNEGVWSGGPPAVRTYTSRDGGATFQRSAATFPLAAGGAVASARPSRAVVAASGPGGGLQLLLTTDGGATSAPVYRGPSAGADDLGFTTAEQGVVIEAAPGMTGPLLMTRDGGHSWQAVAFAAAPR